MFQIGDYVVDSVNGISKIQSIEKLDYVQDKNRPYFLLIPEKEMKSKVYIPVDSAEDRVRKTLTEEEVSELLDEMSEIDSIWVDNDKEREKICREAVKSCEPKMLIGIIKTLYLRKEKRISEGKKNTAVDEKYFKMAEENLYSEIGFVLNMSKEDVRKLMKEKASIQEAKA